MALNFRIEITCVLKIFLLKINLDEEITCTCMCMCEYGKGGLAMYIRKRVENSNKETIKRRIGQAFLSIQIHGLMV